MFNQKTPQDVQKFILTLCFSDNEQEAKTFAAIRETSKQWKAGIDNFMLSDQGAEWILKQILLNIKNQKKTNKIVELCRKLACMDIWKDSDNPRTYLAFYLINNDFDLINQDRIKNILVQEIASAQDSLLHKENLLIRLKLYAQKMNLDINCKESKEELSLKVNEDDYEELRNFIRDLSGGDTPTHTIVKKYFLDIFKSPEAIEKVIVNALILHLEKLSVPHVRLNTVTQLIINSFLKELTSSINYLEFFNDFDNTGFITLKNTFPSTLNSFFRQSFLCEIIKDEQDINNFQQILNALEYFLEISRIINEKYQQYITLSEQASLSGIDINQALDNIKAELLPFINIISNYASIGQKVIILNNDDLSCLEKIFGTESESINRIKDEIDQIRNPQPEISDTETFGFY